MRSTIWNQALRLSMFLSLAAPARADAFCGFYVSSAEAELHNHATTVVLMREGTRTVLSMANNYQGPPQDFAMVVPVPVVLKKDQVKTLSPTIFGRIEALAAPRLVEYWEQDPCSGEDDREALKKKIAALQQQLASAKSAPSAAYGVRVEAEFTVGEYEIVILGAKDSLGLDAWLRQNGYRIPAGAEPVLRPYVEQGSKFFVARVDAKKVLFENGMATLSPLRFHYDAETFSLPVRLGMLNSAGTQDLIVHILAPEQRYQVANHANAVIPTNFDVAAAVRDEFPAFYAALFDRTVDQHRGAVVTEYAWSAVSCDPCPVDPLSASEIFTLGADVLPSTAPSPPVTGRPAAAPTPRKSRCAPGDPLCVDDGEPPPRGPSFDASRFVLTRLHARYGKDTLAADLIFSAAPPIVGGREIRGPDGEVEHGAILSGPSGINTFQARYVIRHPWTGPIACASPQRGIWGGPPSAPRETPSTTPATRLAFAPRGNIDLAALVREDVTELSLLATAKHPPAPPPATAPSTTASKGCSGSCAVSSGGPSGAWIALAALSFWQWRRRSRRVA